MAWMFTKSQTGYLDEYWGSDSSGNCCKSIESILKHGLDRHPLPQLPQPPDVTASPSHPNIRGPQYYNEDRGEP
jgi:hypothetical protein